MEKKTSALKGILSWGVPVVYITNNKDKVCQTQLFISELQRHVSAYSEVIIRLQI